MTDTIHKHPVDAAIEALKKLNRRGDALETFDIVVHEIVMDALPALTAYREGMGEPTPAPTREEAIEAMARAIGGRVLVNTGHREPSCENVALVTAMYRDYATAAYDALHLMGAIREPRGVIEQPEGWGKRVEVTVLGDREEGSGIDQMNQIADRMAGKRAFPYNPK